ncbi:MAG: transposase [Saccharofermentans sp.]|nr:transposase [Saccharofermentans sp.]
MDKKKEESICEKELITLDEAAAYTGIGTSRLLFLSNAPECNFVVFIGTKRYFKRVELEKLLDETDSI